MASFSRPVIDRMPLARRWLAILMLVLLPLQFSLAAVHEYSGHHLIDGDADTPLFHTHGHLGDHASSATHDHGHPADQANGADPDDEDAGHIHLGHAQLLATALVIPSVNPGGSRSNFASQSYPSVSPRRLDRPPLSARR